MSHPIDVMIYGLGAIGSFYAFILNRSERVRLTVVARSNYDAVCQNVRLSSPLRLFAHLVKSPDEASTMDYIICANKAIDQHRVAAVLKPAVDPDRTSIVIIQNGVGNEEVFREQYPRNLIITCVTWVGATQTRPGVVNHTKSENLQIGTFPNPRLDQTIATERLTEFAALLEHGKTRFQICDDIQQKRWEKVVWNAAWNSVTTLTMVDTQTWLHSSPDAEPFTRKLMFEVITIARACGVPLGDDLIDQQMAKIKAMPGIGSSMQVDRKNGRPMEIDVILGFPLQKAKEHGVLAPYLESLCVLLRAIDQRLRAAL
ncbi:2-dehydropantoate 2-reductase [Penicillium ucsense]|uniref:2-dehydropantoate 2-reductase n=1 Tax=Penicillium ucsense TaxID=2839758 RepID=A0A8J8W5I8_9EURO|nr:2-dehydropantoate 2-reductase [Penicillium ucsense]KAF7733757.1 2-dehydropantoate 2-reductase [Penicillium ucsense]